MKKMACGTAAFLVLSGLAACFSNPSAALNNGNYHIVSASPSVQWVRVGDSDQVLLRFTDDGNNGAITTYTIVNPYPTGIAIHQPACYRPYFIDSDTLVCPGGGRDQEQYYTVGLSTGEYHFLAVPALNTADTGVITVRVPPRDLGAAISPTTVASGGTVTITSPSPLVKFLPNDTVLIVAGSTTIRTVLPAALTFSADSSTIMFAATHGDTGVVTINRVRPNFPDIASTITVPLSSANTLNKVP